MTTLGKLRACARGASAAEFAIITPVIGTLLTGTVDLAQFANQGLVLDGAMRVGASYAMGCNSQSYTNCATLITNAMQNYAASLGSSVTVSFCNPGTGCPTLTDNYAPPEFCTWDNATTSVVSCDNSVAACSGAQCPKHGYVKFKAVWTLPSPLMPLGILPSSISRTLTVRVL